VCVCVCVCVWVCVVVCVCAHICVHVAIGVGDILVRLVWVVVDVWSLSSALLLVLVPFFIVVAEVQELFRLLDLDGDGRLNLEKFMAGIELSERAERRNKP